MSREGHLNLDRVIFIGRTYEEYMRMFDLRIEDLTGKRILDCPAQPEHVRLQLMPQSKVRK